MNYEPRKRLNSSHAQMSDSISSIMKRSFVCLREFDTIEDAVDILIRSKQSGAPVIDEHRVVIGYLSLMMRWSNTMFCRMKSTSNNFFC